jgi:branched-chain amino acid aminotransferase
LYLRPLLFGSGAALGVAPSSWYTFCVYASPVGNYFKGGQVAIDLVTSLKQHRSAPKGSGHVKAIGNYAPCFRAQYEAKAESFNEALFLDAKEDRFVEEAGASNFFVLSSDGVLRTPQMGSILPGVTRQSVIQLAREFGFTVQETPIDIFSLRGAKEAFCTGTGASITPIGSVTHKGERIVLGNGKVGELTAKLFKTLTDIQYERQADTHGWLYFPK